MDTKYDHQMTSVVIPEHAIPMNAPHWSWCSVVTSVFGLICCWPFGIVSILAATTAYTDHKSKDFARAQNKRKIAYGFGIAAIIIGIICTIAAVAYYAVIISTLNSYWDSY